MFDSDYEKMPDGHLEIPFPLCSREFWSRGITRFPSRNHVNSLVTMTVLRSLIRGTVKDETYDWRRHYPVSTDILVF